MARSSLARSLLLALSALLAATSARAHGSYPEVTQILLPEERPEQIILGTSFGLVLSEDGGKTWLFSCEQGLSAYAGPYLLGEPRIFARTSGAGLIYSDDGSCSWQSARGAASDLLLLAFAVDPSDSQRVYAIAAPRHDLRNGNSIYVSGDAGVSFEKAVFTSPARSALLTLLVAPSQPRRLFATMFSTPENHPILLRSEDFGEHWEITADLSASLGDNPVELLAIDPLDEDTLYLRILGATAETLATSEDGGLSFVPSVSIPGKLSAFLKLASGTVLVAGTAGTEAFGYRSEAGHDFEPWPAVPHVHALAERNGKLYVAADQFADGYAIAESDDEGRSLKPLAGFEQVQAIKACVAEACAESCAYYAGTGLWPEAVCGEVPVSSGQPPAGAGGEASTGAIGAGATSGDNSGQMEPAPGDAGSPSQGETDERASLRASGGCGCDLSQGRHPSDWVSLLLAGSSWLARRKVRRARGEATSY